MGCFSYMCKKCGTSVRSSSFDGERCIIYFLDGGVVVEEMRGVYDSYGRVFIDTDSGHILHKKKENTTNPENMDSPSTDTHKWEYDDWYTLVDLHFNKDPTTGFAVFHEACFEGNRPKTISDDDPNQGWDKPRMKYKVPTDFVEARCCVCEWPSDGNGGYTCECYCPECGVSCFDDVTIADHGRCRDCHKEWLNNLQPITDEELIKIAREGYGDFLSAFPEDIISAQQHECGDTLADFIVIELMEGTEGEEADGEERLSHAIRLMERAIEELEGVVESLSQAQLELRR